MRTNQTRGRRGAIVPMTAVCLTAVIAFVALALDLGLLMIARNQAQNAADSAAMAGTRALTGDTSTNNNYGGVGPSAGAAASGNTILGKAVDPSTQLTYTVGDYYYDSTS